MLLRRGEFLENQTLSLRGHVQGVTGEKVPCEHFIEELMFILQFLLGQKGKKKQKKQKQIQTKANFTF